ncbi:unnamed protein product [Didymodactylos carnosus]|uniref:Uncharacterized protein n=1 Tax=Didymodactylos carnosus TaxID=1234261 RepID=A0A814QE46_9BILA|nr:unnamed protein product [Didymodactylos carnosus]CAF1119410.1 unnamed protein product [Didymodactylos carnosus]CAF3678718.1 unnamed protein product [Didymodactylos carnosus]CAF3883076.1 unnamed protein product [Didymodactylos carnosus]
MDRDTSPVNAYTHGKSIKFIECCVTQPFTWQINTLKDTLKDECDELREDAERHTNDADAAERLLDSKMNNIQRTFNTEFEGLRQNIKRRKPNPSEANYEQKERTYVEFINQSSRSSYSNIRTGGSQSNGDSMSLSNNRSSTRTLVQDTIKRKCNTLLLKLHLKDDKKRHEEKIRNMSDKERDQFIGELLNELKTDLFTILDNIRQRLKSQRPTDLNDPDYEAKIKLYCDLLKIASSLLEEANKSVKEIFDEFHLFLDELWNAIYHQKNTDEIMEQFNQRLDHHMQTKWESIFKTIDEIIQEVEKGMKQEQPQHMRH